MRVSCVIALLVTGASGEIDRCAADPSFRQCHEGQVPLGDATNLLQQHSLHVAKRQLQPTSPAPGAPDQDDRTLPPTPADATAASAAAVPLDGVTALSAGAAANPRGRLAVIACGLQDRFLIKSNLEQVVRKATGDGYAVDMYIEMVRSRTQQDNTFVPVLGFQASREAIDQGTLAGAVRAAGGNLAHWAVLPGPEQVNSSFPKDCQRCFKRLSQYSPFNTELGANLLRRYQTAERLMRAVEDREKLLGAKYRFVLWTRDDDYWLGPLDLPSFETDSKADNAVYSKDCFKFDGINDKTLLFGRGAAGAVLTRLYSDFWTDDARLDEHSGADANAEAFLKAFVRVKGVVSMPVPFKRLPTAEAVHLKEGGICHKKGYLCDGLPAGSPFERPSICPCRPGTRC